MPTWSEILRELNKQSQPGSAQSPFDFVRRKYLKKTSDLTKRNTILYASSWTSKPGPPSFLSIVDEDLQGLMEVIHGLAGSKLVGSEKGLIS